MIKRTNRNHRAQITFTLHLDERYAKSSLISIEYPVDYNEEPYLEEDRNITGWECPKNAATTQSSPMRNQKRNIAKNTKQLSENTQKY
ncbi:MAG: hypothetical protein ACTSV7_02585 [Candidatus Baldrarchaeia archaeon]